MLEQQDRLKYQQRLLGAADEREVLFCMWNSHLYAEF
jgi:hypothetical protein